MSRWGFFIVRPALNPRHVSLGTMHNSNVDAKTETPASPPNKQLASNDDSGFQAGPALQEPGDATFATVDGTKIRYVDLGAGPAVVLLHGFASSLEVWSQLVPQLAREHRAVALDLKGFGLSDRGGGDYSPRAQAKLVWSLLDHLQIDRAAVVGHSWGAAVALAMALAAPARTTRIAVYDGWVYEEQLSWLFRWARADWIGESLLGFYDERCVRAQLALAFHDPSYVTPERVKTVASRMASHAARIAALATMRAMRFAQQQTLYSTIRVPALVLWGLQDAIASPTFGERLAMDLGAELVIFPRCGHFPMIEAAEASNAALQPFLRRPKRAWWSPLVRAGRRAWVLHRHFLERRNPLRKTASGARADRTSRRS